MILGVDEVGRGAWAGPLVVGAAVLYEEIPGLRDSKLLTAKRRVELDRLIRESNASIGLGWVGVSEIDKIGLSESLKLATRRAVEQIKTPYHEIIIDGTINFLDGTAKSKYVSTLKKADQLISSVSAASIVAKVARDEYMVNLEKSLIGYGFDKHVGYGTALHSNRLEELGPSKEHRYSFAPIAKFRKSEIKINTDGGLAESEVARYLEGSGHKIVDRNWKTKYCEIDIVSVKDDRYYFTEVKYRSNSRHGDGFSYITPRKYKQMKFASELYMQRIENADFTLAAAAVSGKPMKVDNWLEI